MDNIFFTIEIWNASMKRCKYHCVQSIRIRSFFWSAFSRIWIEYGDCSVYLRIQTGCGKYQPVFSGTIRRQKIIRFFLISLLYFEWRRRGLKVAESVVWRCSAIKVLLKILQNSLENTCARSLFFNKVVGWTPIFREHLWWLLLKVIGYVYLGHLRWKCFIKVT